MSDVKINNDIEPIDGLRIIREFISKEEEDELVEEIDKSRWLDKIIGRRVQHYGYLFDYATRQVNLNTCVGPLPNFTSSIIKKLPPDIPVPDQLTVNEYMPGQGIGLHVDTHSAFEESFVSVSLLSDIVMMFRPLLMGKHPEIRQILIPRRSLVIFSGDARYCWEHGIKSRKSDKINSQIVSRKRRISLTLRRVRKEPCNCKYRQICDSQMGSIKKVDKNISSGESCARMLEMEYVVKFYERVSHHFSSTRHSPWKKVKDFVQLLPKNSSLADIGCGNGRHLKCVDKSISAVGIDISTELVKICRDQGLEVCVGDGLLVPFPDNSFDNCMCIAVLHHYGSVLNRIQALKELLRITKTGGKILVVAWAFEQEKDGKRKFEKQDNFVKWHLPHKFDKIKEKSNNGNEYTILQRYCHVYKQGELESLFQQASALMNISNISFNSYYDQGNWCIEALVMKK